MKFNINSEISDFLRPYQRFNRNDNWTHTTMDDSIALGKRGKYDVPPNKIEELLKLYSKTKCQLHLTERVPEKHKYLIIDLDFKFVEKKTVKQSKITEFMTEIMKIIKNIYGSSEDFTCIMTMRKEPYQKQLFWKSGIHLHFPYLVAEYTVHEYIRDKWLETTKINFGCLNNNDDIYDKRIIKSAPWLLYGSTKEKGLPPYEMVKVYNTDEDFSKTELIKLLSIRTKKN